MIYRFENESNTIYNYRTQFIIDNKDKLISEGIDYNTVIKYSKILANIKFKKCKYDSQIFNKIKQYI
jgi:hypothetical protein